MNKISCDYFPTINGISSHIVVSLKDSKKKEKKIIEDTSFMLVVTYSVTIKINSHTIFLLFFRVIFFFFQFTHFTKIFFIDKTIYIKKSNALL